jgi:UDP-N-acetylmuramoylalanine--D-glutamate ligase
MLAIETLKEVDTILLGGTDRGYEFGELVQSLMKYHISNIVLFPDTGARIKAELQKYPTYQPSIMETSSMKDAIQFAFEMTSPGKICLLSTASPSYRLWKNFEEKGEELFGHRTVMMRIGKKMMISKKK